MIEYKPSGDTLDENCLSPVFSEGKLSLTKIWEIVVRTKRLPDDFDLNPVFQGVRDRLRDPEREVRQHALRFLSDLIPITRVTLDDYMRPLLPELLSNLGHSSPALRKGALDTLKTYLNHSRCYDDLLTEILSTTDDPAVLNAAPFLINTNNADGSLQSVVDRLLKSATKTQNYQQEISVQALTRIRSILGDERFKLFLNGDRLLEFERLCDIYGLPLKTSVEEVKEGEKRLFWSCEEFIEDKVILETEITLKTGPAITMKLHEESRPNSVISGAASSDDDSRQDVGVIRVLADDSESDFFEEARRTPRKVRFGGESVKMRTPESDSSNQGEKELKQSDTTLNITVMDAVSIRTRRSLIPIRITSLPPSPRKRHPYVVPKKRLHKSTPNLSERTSSLSRIPLRKVHLPGTPKIYLDEKEQVLVRHVERSEISLNQKEEASNEKNRTNTEYQVEAEKKEGIKSVNKEIETIPGSHNTNTLRPMTSNKNQRKNHRNDDNLSPIPIHNEIQILHNLARSPERVRKKSIALEKTEKANENTFEQAKEEKYSNTIQNPNTNLNDEVKKSQTLVLVKQRNTEEESFNAQNDHTVVNCSTVRPGSRETKKEIFLTTEVGQFTLLTEPTMMEISNTTGEMKKEHVSTREPKIITGELPGFDSNDGQTKRLIPKEETEGTRGTNEDGYFHSFQVCPGANEFNKANEKELSDLEWKRENKNERNSAKLLVTPYTLHESLTTSSGNSEEDLWIKSEAMDNLVQMLKEPGTCESLEPGPAALLFEALLASQRRDRLHSLADHAFSILTQGLRTDVLEKCLGRISFGICKMGAPSGVRLALNVMKKIPPKTLLDEILNIGFQHRTREGALQILMSSSRLLPAADLPVSRMTEFAASALRDRRRRVRQASLEALACLAQIRSNSDVFSVAKSVVESFQNMDQIMQVVRTRLSRRQLPIVDQHGTVRYSTPRDPVESEFLSGHSLQTRPTEAPSSPPSSSSTSSGTGSVNYWKRNMRHLQEDSSFSVVGQHFQSLSEDDPRHEHSQIWGVDTSSLQGDTQNIKDIKTANPAVLRPVYVLQPPEVVKIGGRGHRRYDRGRSFSPPKQMCRQFSEQPSSQTGGQMTYDVVSGGHDGKRIVPAADAQNGITEIFKSTSTSQNSTNDSVHRRFLYREGVRKSFSSEQLYYKEKFQPEYQQFSLSSRSSSTSTTGSSKSGTWIRDFRSGIPVPITSEAKLKFRNNNSNNTSGPLIARRSPLPTKIIQRSPDPPSPQNSPVQALIPLKSYDSESSSYTSPPPPTNQAFVKIDTVESMHLQEDKVSNNNHQDCVDSYAKSPEPDQRTFSLSSPGSSNAMGEEISKTPPSRFISTESLHSNKTHNTIEELKDTHPQVSRYSSGNSAIRALQNMDTSATVGVNKFKSKSVHDLQNFLPEINNTRKNVNSAPPVNIDANYNILYNSNNNLLQNDRVVNSPVIVSPRKVLLPGSLGSSEEIPSPGATIMETPAKDIIVPPGVSINTGDTKLVRRFNRSQSIRRSVREKPRSNNNKLNQSEPNLRPFCKPKDALEHTLTQMNSSEWETSIQGLQGLSRIAKHHPEVIENQIHTVCVNLAKHVKNLRSQVARTACQTATELFSNCKKGIEMEIEEIAGPLLQRTADTNKFLRADANSTLDVMCEQLPLHRVVAVITSKGCCHQNAVVRATSVRLLTDLIKRLGSDKVLQLPKDIRDRILLAGTKALTDGNLETRSFGKEMMGRLLNNAGFSKALHDAVPQNVLRHSSKALSSLKAVT